MTDTKSGITLIELMVVVIIVGILATLAIPRFYKAIETTKVRDAISSLEQIKAGEIIYYNEEYTYWPTEAPVSAIGTINSTLRVFLDTRELNWDYYINNVTQYTFTATAERKSGPHQAETITINQDGTLDFTNWNGPKP